LALLKKTNLNEIQSDCWTITFGSNINDDSIKANVQVKVSDANGKFYSICSTIDLQPKEIVDTAGTVRNIYNLSNKIRIGEVEWNLVNTIWYVFNIHIFYLKILNLLARNELMRLF
jgi:hypothetical protein